MANFPNYPPHYHGRHYICFGPGPEVVCAVNHGFSGCPGYPPVTGTHELNVRAVEQVLKMLNLEKSNGTQCESQV